MSSKEEIKSEFDNIIFNIPLTENCQCTQTRDELLKTCAVFWNMETHQNLLVFKDDKNTYISLNPNVNNENTNN